MKLIKKTILVIAALMFACVCQAAEKKVLVYTKFGKGFVHGCVKACADAVVELGKENGFAVDVSDDPSKFTDDNLKQYSVLVFDNTNNEIFDSEDQKTALQKFVKAGGGFVGVHSASGGMRNWPWYWALVGGKFKMHPPSQPLMITVVEKNHPSTSFLGDTWQWQKDECYVHTEMGKDVKVLLSVDISTLGAGKDKVMAALGDQKTVPVTWCQTFDGGRQWFTALGHDPTHYSDPVFRKHLLGGIQWAMGVK
jgi:type 1 glutamine amidotransferase